jgi:hypothetical protein
MSRTPTRAGPKVSDLEDVLSILLDMSAKEIAALKAAMSK